MAVRHRPVLGLFVACALGITTLGGGVLRAEQQGGHQSHCVALPDAVPSTAGARTHNPQRCTPPPPETTYTLRTTDAQSATPVWKTTYSADSTYELFFALDVTGEVTGTHYYTLFVFAPAGSAYQAIRFTYTATECTSLGEPCSVEPTSDGIRVWTQIPVAGTFIQQFRLYGTWTADVYIDTASTTPTASTTFDITP